MVSLGSHLKIHVPQELRDRAVAFYVGVLGCERIPSRSDAVDMLRLSDGSVIGLFSVPSPEALPEDSCLRSTWLELMCTDVAGLRRRILDAGVREVSYFDKNHFYFQAPGGQVFRLADESER